MTLGHCSGSSHSFSECEPQLYLPCCHCFSEGSSQKHRRYTQLTLEQHRFELHRPTYMWIFFLFSFY